MKKTLAMALALVMVLTMTGCSILPFSLDDLPSFGDLFSELELFGSGVKEPEMIAPADTVSPTIAETTEPFPVSEENPYYDCYVNHADYVLPGSDTTYYARPDVAALTEEERVIAREEIYARHGRSFSDSHLQEYFEARDWYAAGEETKLNACEKDNLFLLEVYELQLSGEVRSNRYIRHMSDPNNFAMGDSNKRYLKAADLSNLEHDNLVVIRNEIYARRGYIFDSENLKTYFYCTEWYRPDPKFSKKSFNKYENANITMCDLYERKLEGEKFSSKNPYKSFFYGPDTSVISYSSTSYLREYDLWYMSNDQLKLARNEILARNGYTFKDKYLLEFFLQCDWYKPNTPPGSKSGMKLSAIEEANIELIKSMEQ